jgi:hypothetical protein
MNIVGEGFPDEIIEQIKVRQKILGSINKTDKQLVWMNAKTGWVRMASSVDLKNGKSIQGYTESNLAKNFILHGGTEYMNENSFSKRSGIGYNDKSAYGIGGTDFGLRPMPGITSAEIKTETRGSLKTATIQLKAYNKQQFDIIDSLYMRLGFSMLLEWGHSMYYDNKAELQQNSTNLAIDFLNGNIKYDTFTETINNKKLNSNGNYDAIIGKVVNFNWTFEKDMSYSITITLRSMGDVIESLKANILVPNSIFSNQSSDSEEDSIELLYSSTEIGKYFLELREKAIVAYSTVRPYTKVIRNTFFNNVDFLKYEKRNIETQTYIRLGKFLQFLNTNIIPYIEDPVTKLLFINVSINNNIIYTNENVFSSDPNICIFNTDVISEETTFINAFNECDEFKIRINNVMYGKLMNIYINTYYIIQQIESLKDKNGNISIYDLLKSICKGINSSLGHVNNLDPSITEDKEVIIIDTTPLPNRDSLLKNLGFKTELAKFNVYKLKENNGSFIRDFNFNTTITNDLAMMITVGATSQGTMVGEDATALSRMNKNFEDRFKKTITIPSPSPTIPFGPQLPPKRLLEQKYKKELEILNEYFKIIGNFSGFLQNEALNDDNSSLYQSVKSIQKHIYNFLIEKNTIANSTITPYVSSPTITGFLPFDLQLIMDGLSGFKIYQKYSINSEFLPSNYPESLEFIIKGISNKISNNEWTTTIESLAIPKEPSRWTFPSNPTP